MISKQKHHRREDDTRASIIKIWLSQGMPGKRGLSSATCSVWFRVSYLSRTLPTSDRICVLRGWWRWISLSVWPVMRDFSRISFSFLRFSWSANWAIVSQSGQGDWAERHVTQISSRPRLRILSPQGSCVGDRGESHEYLIQVFKTACKIFLFASQSQLSLRPPLRLFL